MFTWLSLRRFFHPEHLHLTLDLMKPICAPAQDQYLYSVPRGYRFYITSSCFGIIYDVLNMVNPLPGWYLSNGSGGILVYRSISPRGWSPCHEERCQPTSASRAGRIPANRTSVLGLYYQRATYNT